ncbi:MAG: xanthine dehydrogenase family protein molybdopterin-binding subunit [Candidatus Acidiferrales bacterium]
MPGRKKTKTSKAATATRKPVPPPPSELSGEWIGKPIRRKEEGRLVRGQGKFVDDYKLRGMLHLAFVRSPYGHARVKHVDISEAAKAPGVVCTLTGAEVTRLTKPFLEIGPEPGAKIVDYPMAVDVAHYQGEPVAAVVAESPQAAADAAELVQVDYEPLPAVVEAEQALRDDTVLHDSAGTNRVWEGEFEYGDVDKAFRDARYVVSIGRLHFHRFSSTPLEPNAVIAQWDPGDDRIQFRGNNSFPVIGLQLLSMALGVRMEQMHFQSHDIGGSFGIKITNYPQMAICALASRKAGGRPVKWIETRMEHMLASAHGNERTFLDTRVALDKNGVITAIESRHIDDCGAYPRYEPLGCIIWAQVLPGTYRFRNYRVKYAQVVTNKCPVGPNRGYSRMQQLWFLERVVDLCAHELKIPADEMRRHNYIHPDEFPYTTPNGCVYDSGNYPRMLTLAQTAIGWEEWKRKQKQARAQGRLLGIGIGTTLDSGTNNFGQAKIINPGAPFSGQSGAAIVKLDIDGNIVVSVGSVPQGQGHETTAAQVVADVLNIPPDAVSVRVGFDTDWNAHTGTTGTYASQFAVTSLSAVHGAAQALKAEMKRLAAHILGAKGDELELGVGKIGPEVRVKGADKSVIFWALANLAHVNTASLPEELRDVTLNCRYVWRAPFQLPDIERKYGNLTLTYAAQLHIAVVEVDRETFLPKILDYAVVDDCGTVINPMIVQGQVHGATAHGIGAALLENCAYDADGNLLASTFSDYVPITSLNMPTLRTEHLQSPSPFTWNGAKGMGEGGGAPLHAISAALQDALHASGIFITDSHNNGDTIFRAFERKRQGAATKPVSVEWR